MYVIDDHSLRVYKHIIILINAIYTVQIKFHLNMHLHSLANEASKSNSLYLVDCTITNNYGQLRLVIEEYMRYYNYERNQWERKKMTPVDYRNHLLAQVGV